MTSLQFQGCVCKDMDDQFTDSSLCLSGHGHQFTDSSLCLSGHGRPVYRFKSVSVRTWTTSLQIQGCVYQDMDDQFTDSWLCLSGHG